jgi:hypothetical protein
MSVRAIRTTWLTSVLIVLLGVVRPTEARGQGTIARAAAKSAAQSVKRNIARTLRLDRVRDARTPVVRLTRPRTSFRFLPARRAQAETRLGILRNSHLTSRATPGRPLSASAARARYGLPVAPTRRLTVDLPAGTPVRFNKVLRGGRGIGEITLAAPLGTRAIRKAVPLPSGRPR